MERMGEEGKRKGDRRARKDKEGRVEEHGEVEETMGRVMLLDRCSVSVFSDILFALYQARRTVERETKRLVGLLLRWLSHLGYY